MCCEESFCPLVLLKPFYNTCLSRCSLYHALHTHTHTYHVQTQPRRTTPPERCVVTRPLENVATARFRAAPLSHHVDSPTNMFLSRVRRFATKASKTKAMKKEILELRSQVRDLTEELHFFQDLVVDSQRIDEIVPIGHPVLEQKQETISEHAFASGDVKKMAEKLKRQAIEFNADGLAANQIGMSARLVVLDVDASELDGLEDGEKKKKMTDFVAVANPTWTPLSDETEIKTEVCLSVAGFAANVERYTHVKLDGRNESGEKISMILRGWPARTAQHECDHVDGINFTHRMVVGSLKAYDFAAEAQVAEEEADGDGDGITVS